MDTKQFEGFKWINESTLTPIDKGIIIEATPRSDFFNNNGSSSETSISPETLSNAPFYYTDVSGDFVMNVKVSHNFKDTYDSASIMVMQDFQVWAKACFEKTDFDTNAVVSVVTNKTSDDANGPNIVGDSAWLQITRVDNVFAFHYSVDGETYDMLRFFTLPVEKTIKVGFLAQAPTGQGGERFYKHFSLQQKTVENIRIGK